VHKRPRGAGVGDRGPRRREGEAPACALAATGDGPRRGRTAAGAHGRPQERKPAATWTAGDRPRRATGSAVRWKDE
jgi:hypothetical protein